MKHSPTPKTMPPLDIKGPVGEPLCCMKRGFVSEAEARAFCWGQRPYYCKTCRAWHLTTSRRKR